MFLPMCWTVGWIFIRKKLLLLNLFKDPTTQTNWNKLYWILLDFCGQYQLN